MTNFRIDEIRASTHLDGALSNDRLQVRKYGVYIRFQVTRKFGYFSFNALLIQASAGMALLAACNTFVTWLATKEWFVGKLRADAHKEHIVTVIGHEFADEELGVLDPPEARLRRNLRLGTGEVASSGSTKDAWIDPKWRGVQTLE